MALEARKRRKRTTRRRRRSYSMALAAPRRRSTRRRSHSLREGELGAGKSYAGLAFQFLEAGAGGIAGRIVSNLLPIQNTWIKGAAGAGLSVMVATQLKRPIFAAGMAATFAGDLIRGFNIGGLNEMAQGEFVSPGELSQPQMVYLAPSGEPVFMQEDGSMLYADGSDSGMSLADYE
jgi:hypothetical protein